jgi:hypothetical protein
MSVRRAQAEISVDEFFQWVVWMQRYPSAEDRIDEGFARVCALLKQYGGQKVSPKDELPDRGLRQKSRPDEDANALSLERLFRSWTHGD